MSYKGIHKEKFFQEAKEQIAALTDFNLELQFQNNLFTARISELEKERTTLQQQAILDAADYLDSLPKFWGITKYAQRYKPGYELAIQVIREHANSLTNNSGE